MYINNQGHMTKMAAMPIYGINPSKIFSGTGGSILYDDPVMTLTYFKARSTWVAYVFEWVNC